MDDTIGETLRTGGSQSRREVCLLHGDVEGRGVIVYGNRQRRRVKREREKVGKVDMQRRGKMILKNVGKSEKERPASCVRMQSVAYEMS